MARTAASAYVCVALSFFVATGISARNASADIIEWNRHAEFTAGGSNPSDDSFGSPVWRYEWMTGDALTGSDPWWDNTSTLMVWDTDWWGRGFGAWSRGDNMSPMIDQNLLTHNLYTISVPYIPLARWTNSMEGETDLTISGFLKVVWNGPGYVGSPTLVDIVYGLQDGDTGEVSIITSWTVAKPIPTDTVLDHLYLPISHTITLDEGDSLFWTVRGHDTFAPYGRWIEMWDLLRIRTEIVPAPASLALIAGGLGASARRRR